MACSIGSGLGNRAHSSNGGPLLSRGANASLLRNNRWLRGWEACQPRFQRFGTHWRLRYPGEGFQKPRLVSESFVAVRSPQDDFRVPCIL